MIVLASPLCDGAQTLQVRLFMADNADQIDLSEFLGARCQRRRRNLDGVVIGFCRRASASRIHLVFFPEPLPSSATLIGEGSRRTISPAYFSISRASARVSPYSGKTQMVSNRAEPTSSYKYFDGSSLCPGLVRLWRTSAANSDTWRTGRKEVSMGLPGWGLISPRRNGTLRRHTDNAVGTSFETIAAACTQRCAASHPSSHSVCRRRNLRNS